ncbi:hypothetical protein AVEN_238382-1 [Araneus ventricosus]|uniref:Uncharacterized protein n=1 Tax=Araneus ventricosus TaxID=182803 RepID=A0A4Y2DMC1_ARAVE|nr:hypothetical protein AVEN_238382-1 [Araneus ventricosus]
MRRLGYVIRPKSGLFPTHSSRKIAHVIRGGSKVRYRRSSIPLFLLLHMMDFLFSSLFARSQSRQNLCFAATLAATPPKGHPAIPIGLQTIRNSISSIHLSQFSSVFKTDDWFFLPVFQKFQSGAAVNAPL